MHFVFWMIIFLGKNRTFFFFFFWWGKLFFPFLFVVFLGGHIVCIHDKQQIFGFVQISFFFFLLSSV